MKSKDLRIGNLVTIELTTATQEVIDLMCDGINTMNYEGIPFEIIHGIPLTKEWLLKFGLNTEFLQYSLHSIFEADYGFQVYSGHGCMRVDCYYVHELQNLYFALTGEELEFKK